MFVASLLLTAGLAQAAAPRQDIDVAPGDARVWQLYRAERVRREAETRAAGASLTAARVRALLQLDRVDEALDLLMRLVSERPLDAADVLRGLRAGTQFSDGARDYSPKLTAIFAEAHARAAELPREDAAVLEFALVDAEGVLHGGSGAWQGRAAAASQRYAGTHAAALAEIQLVPYDNMTRRLDALDAIARAHPGTDIAAAALYQKGWDLGVNAFNTGPDRQPDPVDRFRRVLAIAGDLESGRYPRSEWTEKAPSLVVQFYGYKPEYAPGSLDTMIDGYRAFLKKHFVLDSVNPFGNGSSYLVTSKVSELFKLKGDDHGVESLLRELEADSPDRQGAAYLHGLWLAAGPERVARLEAIASDDHNIYAAKALATLALDDLQQGRPAAGRAKFQQFLERYPRSEYAWLAALHAAEALAVAGDGSAVEREFSAAAEKYADTTMAVILGRVLAAHAAESRGEPSRALDHYTTALGAWPRQTYVVSLFTSRHAPEFRRNDVVRRSALLRESLARPGGDLLERGRWQLANGQQAAAIATLQDVTSRFATSPVRGEATILLHRAQLEAALDLADIERPDRDPAAAAARIEELARQPLDPATVAARIARASQLWSRGDAEAARGAMAMALSDWIKGQPHDAPKTDLEADVAAIRDVVFRPLGGGVYRERRGWNAFQWPAAPPRFLLVDPEVTVTLPSGDDTTMAITRPLPDYANVVISDKTMTDLLGRALVALGGTKRRQPGGIMETPNQPVGESMNILALWNEFFPARPGHWGGYEFTSYPRLTRIRFLDAARTRAAADVTIGYSGATVVLEKRGTAWTPVKLTNEWIT